MVGERYEFTFTVFTPTFNRKHTLGRVFESLKSQTFRDFEWLIVDDGSTDGTGDLVDSWRQTVDFEIKYIYQKNQGKGAAYNTAVPVARGELFLTLDSDDQCVPEALERFKYHWDSIPEGRRGAFSAVTVLCRTPGGEPVGSKFPRDVVDSDSLEISYKYKVRGEKWGFHRTDVLRRHPFPVLAKSKYVPEGVVWRSIAREHKTRFVNEMLRIYNTDTTDSLMRGGAADKLAAGVAFSQLSILNEDIVWVGSDPIAFLRSATHYSRFSFHDGKGVVQQFRSIGNGLSRLLWLGMLPVGLAAFLRDRMRADPARRPSEAPRHDGGDSYNN
jgi:glycosyltransferase involved in cell wall biosynthesis